jgi:integrase/recombinase XerD
VSLARDAKNLAEVEPQTEKRAAGATETSQADMKGKLVEFAWELKKKGLAEATIVSYVQLLRRLNKCGANLYDPESVKEVIATQSWSPARKNNAVKAYKAFLKISGLTWKDAPKYKVPQKLPFIPLEEELDQLIAGCSPQMSTFLRLLKETGMRRSEALNLKWTDIDLRTNTVRVTPLKGGNPRVLKIPSELVAKLNDLKRRNASDRVFSYKNAFYLQKTFQKQRKRIARKLGNSRLLQIHFHTFRHWKATMEYHKTRDILHVMRLLGHKNIKNTLIYTQLIDVKSDEYICKTAKTVEEAAKLIEAGFDYVCEIDGIKLFRKRK